MKQFKKQFFITLFVLVILTIGTVSSVQASEDEWQFTFTPLFFWGMSVDGTSEAAGNTLPIDLDFEDEIWSNLSNVFTFHFEAQKGKWVLFAEYQFAELEPETKVGPIKVDIDFENYMAELGAGYQIFGNEKTRWEILGGVRYFDQEVELELGNRGPNLKTGDEWWNGFAGVRVIHEINKDWAFEGRVDYGADDDSNDSLNAVLFFDYRFNEWGSVFFGYKYMDIDYDNDKTGLNQYAYDADQQGPLGGLNIRW